MGWANLVHKTKLITFITKTYDRFNRSQGYVCRFDQCYACNLFIASERQLADRNVRIGPDVLGNCRDTLETQ